MNARNVQSIYRPWVVAASGDERLATAASRMQNEQVGSLVVLEHGRFAGILTERDLVRRSPTASTRRWPRWPTT